MKAWKKWGRFRFKRPLHENSRQERLPCKQRVIGSSPISGSIFFKGMLRHTFIFLLFLQKVIDDDN